MITHHPNCTPRYPEKPEGEAPQHIDEIPIDDGEVVRQCSDCGAFEIIPAPPAPRCTRCDEPSGELRRMDEDWALCPDCWRILEPLECWCGRLVPAAEAQYRLVPASRDEPGYEEGPFCDECLPPLTERDWDSERKRLLEEDEECPF